MLDRRAVGAVLILALQVAAACSEYGPEPSIAGEWHLATIDGQALPRVLDATTSIMEERLVLAAGGGYHQFQVLAHGASSTATFIDATGVWLKDGDEVTFASVAAFSGASFTARLVGANELRRTRDGAEWVYRRQ
jgi:hypothetical protein